MEESKELNLDDIIPTPTSSEEVPNPEAQVSRGKLISERRWRGIQNSLSGAFNSSRRKISGRR